MIKPRPLQFNNADYFKKPMPAELAGSRQWQLVYGEFRAPKYMAVMRDYVKRFDWDNVKESDVAMAIKLLTVWVWMPRNRLREWPTMNELLNEFSGRLVNAHERLSHQYINAITIAWIDNDVEWHALIEEPYAALQR